MTEFAQTPKPVNQTFSYFAFFHFYVLDDPQGKSKRFRQGVKSALLNVITEVTCHYYCTRTRRQGQAGQAGQAGHGGRFPQDGPGSCGGQGKNATCAVGAAQQGYDLVLCSTSTFCLENVFLILTY